MKPSLLNKPYIINLHVKQNTYPEVRENSNFQEDHFQLTLDKYVARKIMHVRLKGVNSPKVLLWLLLIIRYVSHRLLHYTFNFILEIKFSPSNVVSTNTLISRKPAFLFNTPIKHGFLVN